ncbi:MAG TPA: helix-turn-helix domain-containing protein [Gemmatimonadales bacterium]|jgi:AraC-like DNA-binding protein|nr:helix-turn-helix domain-containing protein [Gemmatimonadales bacterium]
MLVLAAVSDLQYQRLRGAVGAAFSLARAATWDVALETIRCRPVEIAVVDPMLGGARGQEVERLRVLFPSLPLILYTPMMTPELAPVLLAMGKCGITRVVLSRTEDHPDRLRDLLGAEALHATSNRLLAQLTTALAPLPPALRWVLEDAMRAPGTVQTIQQVAARARVDRGTCARWCYRAGLPSPRDILAATRVLYAHRLLKDPGFTIEDVAKRLGYAQTKTLQQHARRYLGLTAGEMRLSLTADEATAHIVQDFLTPVRRNAASAS